MHSSRIRYYTTGSSSIGIGLGAISILARGVNGNVLFASPAILFKFGLFGGLGFVLMGSIALFLFAPFSRFIRENVSQGYTIGDLFNRKLKPTSYWFMLFLSLILSLDGILLQGYAAGLLLNMIYHIPLTMGLVIFCCLSLVYAGIGGFSIVQRLAVFQLAFIFCMSILFPVYFFVSVGVGRVYEGIHLFHPYLLVMNNHDMWLFIATGLIIGLGQVISDRSIWQRIFVIGEKKLTSTFLLGGVVWSTISFAFTILILIVIFTGGIDQHDFSLLLDLTNKIGSPLLLSIFVISLLSSFTVRAGMEWHSTTSLWIQVIKVVKPEKSESELLRTGYLFALLLSAIALAIILIFPPSVIGMLLVFGLIYAVILTPILILIFSKQKVGSSIPFSIIVSLIFGYTIGFHWSFVSGIFVAFGLSVGLNLLFLFIRERVLNLKA